MSEKPTADKSLFATSWHDRPANCNFAYHKFMIKALYDQLYKTITVNGIKKFY